MYQIKWLFIIIFKNDYNSEYIYMPKFLYQHYKCIFNKIIYEIAYSSFLHICLVKYPNFLQERLSISS